MPNSVITTAGAALLARAMSENFAVDIDQMIFADIPGLDTDTAPDPATAMPAAGQIVLVGDIEQTGRINEDTVVYSRTLRADEGDYYINWLGLYSSENNVLVAACHVPRHYKFATTGFRIGNTFYKNFGLEYADIANLTGIVIDAFTWQQDLTEILANYAPAHDHPYEPLGAVAAHNGAGTPHPGKFEPSGAVAAHVAAANPHTQYLQKTDIAGRNLLLNGDFQVCQRGITDAEGVYIDASGASGFKIQDGWESRTNETTTGMRFRSLTAGGLKATMLTDLDGKYVGMGQVLPLNTFRGKSVTLSCRVSLPSGRRFMAWLWFGGAQSGATIDFTAQNTDFKTYSASVTIPIDATTLSLTAQAIMSTAGETLYIDWFKLEQGSISTPYQPNPYELELAACRQLYDARLTGRPFRSYNTSEQQALQLTGGLVNIATYKRLYDWAVAKGYTKTMAQNTADPVGCLEYFKLHDNGTQMYLPDWSTMTGPQGRVWVSGPITPVLGARSSATHNLNLTATELARAICEVRLKCTTDQWGYVVGEYAQWGTRASSESGTDYMGPVQPLLTANAISCITGNNGDGLTILNKTTGELRGVTLSAWAYEFRIWLPGPKIATIPYMYY